MLYKHTQVLCPPQYGERRQRNDIHYPIRCGTHSDKAAHCLQMLIMQNIVAYFSLANKKAKKIPIMEWKFSPARQMLCRGGRTSSCVRSEEFNLLRKFRQFWLVQYGTLKLQFKLQIFITCFTSGLRGRQSLNRESVH